MFLPRLLATITNHPRQLVVPGVDFNWSPNCWTHNVFRVYELVFGRRAGIRWEGTSYLNEDGGTVQISGTVENFLAVFEGAFRAYFKSLSLNWSIVYVPRLAGIPMGLQSPFMFAIAFDNAQATSALTLSCTVTGSNLFMFALPDQTATAGSATATYNGVSMNVDASVMIQAAFFINGFNLPGPSTGTNNLIVTGAAFGIVANTYTGCAQTANDQYVTASSGGTTVTCTVTTSTANCWMMMMGTGNNNTPTAGTNMTGRSLNAAGGLTPSSGDSNGNIATGSFAMAFTGFSAQPCGAVAYKFAQSASGGTVLPYRALLGVGI